MAELIAFNPYLSWVDITNPNEIPPDFRTISATDLLRYEQFGITAVAKINEHSNALEQKLDKKVGEDRLSSLDRLVDGKLGKIEADGIYATKSSITTQLKGQVDPLVASAIASDGTITATVNAAMDPKIDEALAAVDLKVDTLDLITGSDTRIGQPLSASSPYAYVQTDLDNNIIFAVLKDGSILEPPAELVGPGTFEPVEIGTSSGYAYVLTDLDNNLLYAVRQDGTIEGTIDRALNVPDVEAAFDPTLYYVESVGADGAKSLTVHTLGTGAKRVLTSGSNDTEPVIRLDGRVTFKRNGVQSYVPFDGDGKVHPVMAGPNMTTWGDSLTAANNWQNRIRELVPGLSIDNQGIGSQTSTHIAMRQGGLPAPMTIEGGVIPASGGVTVTQGASIILMTTNYPARSTTGFLAGVHGTLSYAGGNTTPYTFTRTTAGDAVAVTNPVNFITDSQFVGEDRIVTFWNGRNNVAEPVWEHIDAMVARLTSMVKRFLIISTTSSSAETEGTWGYNNIKRINDTLRTKWVRWEDGGNFVDLQEHLRLNALSIMGLTPTAEDTASINGGALPPQIMIYNSTTNTYDNLHFSTDTQRLVIGPYIHSILLSKGWI